jgi:hypothetical protein
MNVFSKVVTIKASYGEAGNRVLQRFWRRGRKNVGLIKPGFLEINTPRHSKLKFREKQGNDH